jgi:deoxyadenosine/deoxycytidine kinase
MMRHIELIGLPAAGKTTLVENLQHGGLARDRDIIAPLKRAPVTAGEKAAKRYRDLTSVSRQLFGNPARSHRIWRACTGFGQPSLALQVRMYLNCLRVDSLARSDNGNTHKVKDVILDQGIFQAVWSLALRANIQSRERLLQCSKNLLDNLAIPELVILVDIPADIACRRLSLEPDAHGRLAGLLESNPDWMRQAQEILDWTWAIACDEPMIKTFRYDPANNSLHDVERAIRRLSEP